jgi:peptide/nickel transport system permease protein
VQSIPIFFGITILSFALMSASGNPLRLLVFGEDVKQEEIARVAARFGLNDPWIIQYLRWLVGDDWLRWDADGDGVADGAFLLPLDADGDGVNEAPGTRRGILRGDFGNSLVFKRPVLALMGERIVPTLEISIPALFLGLSLGCLLGILAAITRGGLIDNALRVFSATFNAIPLFWFGLMALLIFGSALKIFPLGDRCRMTLEPSCPPLTERLNYLILPLIVSTVGGVAGLTRVMRASMLDIIHQDYIRTARAKGIQGRQVWLRHAARNALIPIATGLGPAITGLLAGSVIIERLFNYPGLGLLLYSAATSRDFPLVMASVIYGSVATIVGYLLSDVLYALIDPRIKFG